MPVCGRPWQATSILSGPRGCRTENWTAGGNPLRPYTRGESPDFHSDQPSAHQVPITSNMVSIFKPASGIFGSFCRILALRRLLEHLCGAFLLHLSKHYGWVRWRGPRFAKYWNPISAAGCETICDSRSPVSSCGHDHRTVAKARGGGRTRTYLVYGGLLLLWRH